MRRCLDCPRLTSRSRCLEHERAKDRQRGTSSQRGYDSQHQRIRAAAIAVYDPLSPCWRCNQPLGANPSLLDLGHRDDRQSYSGLEHRECNRGRR